MQGDLTNIATHGLLPGSSGQSSAQGAVTAARAPSWPRKIPGMLVGCCTALLGCVYLLIVGLAVAVFLPWPRTRSRALAVLMSGARRITALDRGRRFIFFGDRFPEHYKASDQKVLRYLAIHSYMGLVCSVVVGLLGVGAILAAVLAVRLFQGYLDLPELLTQLLLGGVLLFLDVQGIYSLMALDARLARECFGPSEGELLRQRIDELATSRAAVVQAVDAERRRIERDLHDGIQQRLVALAMLLGRARRSRGRSPEQVDALLRQAHQESQEVITELREAAWRVYPSALDSLGLEEALSGVSERCSLPIRMDFEVGRPLPQAVETAAYFVVSECVTNAAKHSGATAVSVGLALHGGVLVVRIQDNGGGGADPAGSGLTGLRGRVGALDGLLHIDSPLGGPTTITAELPCA
ncbi:sensor histidine kinase [Streptomyces luomodiensis]|uniref:histidine kinase n=1 Tax=Streptomyces luomodiensis TaxID=3026192 RepID=A0ABY9UNM8_9ACTN|nr:sensor histidine kinase [Streptomyces sp. SCA4-21]WNE94142.1 sensor histidine kinase [Streptomyces sp. SCA4-21]